MTPGIASGGTPSPGDGADGADAGREHTWDASSRRRLRASLAMTPDERLRVLEELYRVALDAGAIDRYRRRKQAAVDAAWGVRADSPP